MEIIIVICLLVVIALLVKDNIVINRGVKKKKSLPVNPDLPDIMGQPKPFRSLPGPKSVNKRPLMKAPAQTANFKPETELNGSDRVIPEEELDEVFGDRASLDLEEEEEEWRGYGEPNGEDGFATGGTFEELSTVGSLLQQESLEPSLKQQAVDIVHRIQGTDLFSLLEDSIENASQKIARLLDKGMVASTDSGSFSMGKSGFEGFDIGEFV